MFLILAISTLNLWAQPTAPTNFQLTPLKDTAALASWTPSVSPSIDSTAVTLSTTDYVLQMPPQFIGDSVIYKAAGGTVNSVVISGLETYMPYYISVFVKQGSQWSGPTAGSYAEIMLEDSTPPANVTNFNAALRQPPGTGNNFRTFDLTWNSSVSLDRDSMIILYRTDGQYPTAWNDPEARAADAPTSPLPATANSATFYMAEVPNVLHYIAAFVKDVHGLWSPAAAAARDTVRSGASEDTVAPDNVLACTVFVSALNTMTIRVRNIDLIGAAPHDADNIGIWWDLADSVENRRNTSGLKAPDMAVHANVIPAAGLDSVYDWEVPFDFSNWVEAVVAMQDSAGNWSDPAFSSPVQIFVAREMPAPREAGLSLSAQPNPFKTAIRFHLSGLSQKELPELKIYDLAGRCVAQLTAERGPRTASYAWNAAGQGSGIYVAKLQVGNQTKLQRIVLMK